MIDEVINTGTEEPTIMDKFMNFWGTTMGKVVIIGVPVLLILVVMMRKKKGGKKGFFKKLFK